MENGYKVILVPVDTEEPQLTETALKQAEYLAKLTGAAIRVVSVKTAVPPFFMGERPQQIFQMKDEVTHQVEAQLAELTAALDVPAEKTSYVVLWGTIYDEILKEAETCRADLIVVGSRRPSMSTYLLGSNASRVVRHATTSVLVVR
ncbi:universal stress protein [Enterobacillus tribolii]|uniref:Universal stress protein n=1 Tax=Enterobacillus tribolii TaxID=1487935 RepID=A0A370R2K4_9GAMM|nr:universal stress protein [Enterobacillus tribolii]MBW7984674.1 universal stress protein UspA [Enterobacillus tribolii]RDK96672.1 universal stress protein G [Enterobacillus tribolii]